MLVNFVKMHALGNDFVIIDAITQNVKLTYAYIKRIADRHIGIGCDQIILLEPPMDPIADFYYKIYNADGSIAEQCLNGARCAAKFILDQGLINKKNIIADCLGGRVSFSIEDNQLISTNIGIINQTINIVPVKLQNINIPYQIYSISIGNPHAICIFQSKNKKFQEELDYKKYELWVQEISDPNIFPKGVNVGFANVLDPDNIKLVVFERGVGETLACGTNAVATFLVAQHIKLIADNVKILFKLGALQIKSDNGNIIITGPANSVFAGKFNK